MRKLLIGAVAGVVMLVVAAIAMATTTQTFNQTYTTKKPNTSTGTKFQTNSSEDANDENNKQPKATREFDIKFPAGTKINYKAAPVCTNVDESAASPCPANTKIGTGHAQVLLPFKGTAPIDANVTAYNRKSEGTTGLVLFVEPQAPNQAPVFLKPVYKGLTLKTATPPNCIASTNQNGHCVKGDGSDGVEAVLTEFDLTTKAVKKGKKVYLKTPPKCPKTKTWTFTAKITYDDGTSVTKRAATKCKK